MPVRLLLLQTAALLWFAAGPPVAADEPAPALPGGEQMTRFLDSLDVEHRWLAHTRVDWQTGAVAGPSKDPVHSTHCSAFVAAACERLAVPILHPPDHPQKLLANAQFDWLQAQGPRNGWRQLAGATEAQNLANQGGLVVAVFKDPRPEHPGHIAVVRPASKSAELLAAEGPDIIQAGAHNYGRTSVRQGFASHPKAFEQGRIAYFAHGIPAPAIAPPPPPSPTPTSP